jgi:predicted NUDIX family phosphoesterase
MILTLPRTQAPALPESGCWSIDHLRFLQVQAPLWQIRADVEHNEAYLQPIVYLLLLNPVGQVWCYQRAGGDARLDGRCSCGIGGHVDHGDQASDAAFDAEHTLQTALLREFTEEIQVTAADLQHLRLRGLIYEGLSAVGRVHLGVLYTALWQAAPPQPRAGEKLRGLGFMPLQAVATDLRFELWSRLAAQYLSATPLTP